VVASTGFLAENIDAIIAFADDNGGIKGLSSVTSIVFLEC
jgi:hypothetical protein